MEDENGLELSLGLSCGASSAKSKEQNGSTAEESERVSKTVDDFKKFLHAGPQKQESGSVFERSYFGKPLENFFDDLSKATDGNTTVNLDGRGLWASNRTDETEEEKPSEAGSKRKILFNEINKQKKREIDAHHANLHGKSKVPHISIAIEDGSFAENEDVAESEGVDSTSRPVLQHDERSKQFVGINSSSENLKKIWPSADLNTANIQEQNKLNIASENDFKLQNLSLEKMLPVQSINVMNIPNSLTRDSNSVGTQSSSGQPLPGIIQMMPPANSNRLVSQLVNSGNSPGTFGYSSRQLPMFDKDKPWGNVSYTLQFHPSYTGRGLDDSGSVQPAVHNLAEATLNDGRISERAKVEGKQHVIEECSSNRAAEVKRNCVNLRASNGPDQPTGDALSLDFPAINPGIAADLKFGGSGSHPNLPWVSTTGSGPHGRTISGVTYRFSANQIRIVCACHGSHLSPEEFVQHASEEYINPENNTTSAAFPGTNPAASAQS